MTTIVPHLFGSYKLTSQVLSSFTIHKQFYFLFPFYIRPTYFKPFDIQFGDSEFKTNLLFLIGTLYIDPVKMRSIADSLERDLN